MSRLDSTETLGRGVDMLRTGMSGILGDVKEEYDEEEARLEHEIQESLQFDVLVLLALISYLNLSSGVGEEEASA